MTAMPKTIPIISSISEIAGLYEAWLCDIWGVIHNGEQMFAEAALACQEFRVGGGTVVLITNAPRPSSYVRRQLDAIGVPESTYDAIISSGDVTRGLIAQKPGSLVYHLGPKRDRPIYEGLDIRLAKPDQADIVLCSGLFDDETEGPDDYADLLRQLRNRNLTMICANPDIIVERGSKIVYCAGVLAEAYLKLGGEVIYAGKPHLPIYEKALKKVADIRGDMPDRSKILAIGDGLKTDIAGARAASLDVLFVASGIHVDGHSHDAALDSEAVAKLFADSQAKPIAVQSRLQW